MKTGVSYKSLEPARAVLVITFLIVAMLYLTWRIGTINPEAKVFSWVLYAAEAYGIVNTLLHLLMTWRLTERVAPPPVDGHTVDVFIPTINESADMVRHTLLASINMDYPHQTWLLDDGNREEMALLAKEMDCRYVTRSDNQHAKAGNLNNALKQSTADFVAVFDADHAPKRNFLTHTLGYFRDNEVAFVQAPQDFFNLDSYQHRATREKKVVWTEQSLFFRVIQRGKDYWNAAFFCGSCAVIRRNVLEEIGGFATGTVTEDLHTSLKIHKRGYKSVYHAEPLAFGIAPSSVVPFMKQRIRWGQGAMQVWRKEGIVFFARGLTLAQRLNYLASVLTYFDGWQKGFFYIAPVIVLVTGTMPIVALNQEFLLYFIPYYFLTFWVFEEVGRGYGRTLFIEQYNMGRFAGFAWSTLGFFKSGLKFSVTPKGATPKQDTYRFITPQIGILLLNSVSILLGIFFYFWLGHLPVEGLIANIIWAVINLSLALTMIIYSLRLSVFHRAEYRFPIPLPARVDIGEQTGNFSTVDNVSSSGCRIYGSFPKALQRGDGIRGAIMLPAGSLPFKGKVTAIIEATNSGEKYIKALGCCFEWDNPRQRDALDLFLYGSDLQWHLNHLSERIVTPLDWLFGYTKGEGEQKDFTAEHWAVMMYKEHDAAEEQVSPGLIAISDKETGSRSILVFRPISAATDIVVAVFTRRKHTLLQGKLALVGRKLDCPTSTIYMYEAVNLTEIEKWPSTSNIRVQKRVLSEELVSSLLPLPVSASR
jgi:cellulose synthase (UDP-forming)